MDMTFGHPLVPDMIADPSIVEFDGVFYCYATTDGYGHGLATAGTPVVWKSKDFLNWSFQGSIFADNFDAKFWAPSSLLKKDGRYYLYPTLDHQITLVVADSPEGPFRTIDGKDINKESGWRHFPIESEQFIDAEVFVDDDGQAYMVWAKHGICKLTPDWTAPDGEISRVHPKRGGYSEGQYLFKRNGIYYYMYTLEGHENYKYAYMMSRVSPMGPWEAPENDIISGTDHEKKIYGPGHGCFFCPQGSDQWYHAYLEFGRGGTTRQVWVDKLNFNEDGTIQFVELTLEGVGALRPVEETRPNLAHGKTATASSLWPPAKVHPIADRRVDRTEQFNPDNALDGSNGTRWVADEGDDAAWYMLDLGEARDISHTELYFVRPTAGHAYRLEHSLDGEAWEPYGGHEDVILQSPHVDEKSARARYLKVSILKGIPGIWDFRVY
ncbi:family 43 glycosylhydrolase [Candidatus Sumerlaeota bacterium]|nr:family 43 glycosylhydrolase [Candidatus Sumerlaeota bacterium]